MNKRQRTNLIRILLAAVLLAVAWMLPLEGWTRLIAFLIPYALCGWDVLWDAVRNIAHGQVFDEKFLMAIATAGVFALGDYKEGVAVMIFYQIGEWFQGIAVGKSRKDIAKLMDIRPDTATVLRDGAESVVLPDEVHVGETIV